MNNPKCLCQYEIENKLPRTKFCRIPCSASKITITEKDELIYKVKK